MTCTRGFNLGLLTGLLLGGYLLSAVPEPLLIGAAVLGLVFLLAWVYAMWPTW